MTSLTKNLQTPTKKFFSIENYKTYQDFWAVKQLSSAYGAGVMLMWTMCDQTLWHEPLDLDQLWRC